MDIICANIIKTDIESLLSSKDKIHADTTDVPIDMIDIFIKMTHAKYAFNMKNDELNRVRQRLIDIYNNNPNAISIREELATIRAYDSYSLAALDTWREGNSYILYKSTYIGALFNMARTAATALAASLNREYWLETLVLNDAEMKTSLRIAVEEADAAEIETRRRLCIAVDEQHMNKPLIEIYDTIRDYHLSLSKAIATLSVSPLCIKLLSENSDYYNMFTAVFPNIVYINSLHNALNTVNAMSPSQTNHLDVIKEFEDARDNIIVELTNLYMYKLNTSIYPPA